MLIERVSKRLVVTLMCFAICATPGLAFGDVYVRALDLSVDDVAHDVASVQTDDGPAVALAGSMLSGGHKDLVVIQLDLVGGSRWARSIGGADEDAATALIQGQDGALVVAGYTRSHGAGGEDVMIAKIDTDGNGIWVRTWGGNGDDDASGMVETADGRLCVAGNSDSFNLLGASELVLACFSSAGTMLDYSIVGNPLLSRDLFGRALVATGSGFVVVGDADGPSFSDEGFIAEFDDNLNLLHARHFWIHDADEEVHVGSVDRTTDGGFVVVGWTEHYPPPNHLLTRSTFLAKFDASLGVDWIKYLPGSWPLSTAGRSVEATGDDQIVGVFQSYNLLPGHGADDVEIVKLSNSGVPIWSRWYGGDSDESPLALTRASDGGFLVAGSTESFTDDTRDVLLMKLDDEGYTCLEDRGGRFPVNDTISIATFNPTLTVSTGLVGSSPWSVTVFGRPMWQETVCPDDAQACCDTGRCAMLDPVYCTNTGGVPQGPSSACLGDSDADGYDPTCGDCDDDDSGSHPDALEQCDGNDNDCDDAIAHTETDDDDDLYVECSPWSDSQGDDPEIVGGGDCDDGNAGVHPGAAEQCCDGLDNDCDGFGDSADPECDGEDLCIGFGAGGKSDLVWYADPAADSYALYRGSISEVRSGAYDHRCDATEIANGHAEDPDLPWIGEGFYYLVTRMDWDGLDVTLGSLGSGVGGPRPDSNTLTCGPQVHVDPDATGANDGSSWADAYADIGSAFSNPRATYRGMELWVHGTLDSPGAFLNGASRSGAMILGGFAGDESASWERDPETSPTLWRGSGAPGSYLLMGADASVVVDGIDLENAERGVDVTSTGDLVELRDISLAQVVDGVHVISNASPLDGIVLIEDSAFLGGGIRGIYTETTGGMLSGRIRGNTFNSWGAAMRLFAGATLSPVMADSVVRLQVVGNSISGGNSGVVLGATLSNQTLSVTNGSTVASNVIHDVQGAAVSVIAEGNFDTDLPASVVSMPVVTGNTLTHNVDGVSCSAIRNDFSGNPSAHAVHATPAIWNNLITLNASYGVREFFDHSASSLVSDPPTLTGNDFYGNGCMYFDEGTVCLDTIAEVNALSGASANWSGDPVYVDPATGDYHLFGSSPAIDAGHVEAPGMPGHDIDGEGRVDGSAPDTGADEHH